ncbi:HlyD family efflux transporter periplasmic adaptor subunit [Luteibacter sp. 22Crub2.1]|uniref:HlyD family secretion protein n=1 Tax=Luteibacter sp. 22Crub2.1 TaxID=1283288 RepID=UPI0009A63F44|nr:HlyD family efflux transporter periplasmic adaptor subunit [Luteibacter sp. 22Crub2.1]SKB59169.1 membrane fusion protein [Luteibacter sp. 22Crub2.1]
MESEDNSSGSIELFRREALEAQRTPWLGHVRIATPTSHLVWSVGSVVFGAALVLLLIFGSYTRRERVTGLLLPQAGLIQVASWSSGTIDSISVSEGDVVHAGQSLFAVSGEHVSQKLGDTGANVSISLERQRERLRTDIVGAQSLADEQSKGLSAQKRSLTDQMRQDDALLKIYNADEAAESALLGRMTDLYKRGYVSQVQFNQQQSAVFAAQAQVRTIMKSRAESSQQMASLTDQLAQVPMATQSKIGDLSRQLEQLNQSLDQNEANRLSVQRASHAGVVSSILVKQGQAITSGQTLMTEVPALSPLEAVLLVPSKAIGFVKQGTTVALHYDAYPYQKFGIQDGIVKYVSANALSPKQISDLTGQPLPAEAQYEVVVTLAEQSIHVYGQTQKLVSGMALDADILLDQRRLLEWVFEPIYGMRKDDHAD